jgi:hypothetical protein
MELPEPISWINKRLQDEYGYHDLARPYWRVVFSEEQLEKRWGTFRDFDDNGNFIREVTEIREVPKYRQWIQGKWVLERLTTVPLPNVVELLGEQFSYEPVWVFEDNKGNALPPIFRACKFVINAVLNQAARTVGAKYRDPDSHPEEAKERQKSKIEQLELDLFGNETPVGDALAQDSGVGYGIRRK